MLGVSQANAVESQLDALVTAYLDFGHLSGPRGDAEVAEQVGG